MGDYTKLQKSEAQEILKLYGKGDVTNFRALSLGISNSNYDVKTSKGRFLLKVSNDKDHLSLSKEQEILHRLKEEGFPFSLVPFTTNKNELVYEYKDFSGVLYPFVDGIPPGPSDQTCFEIGKGLATLHKIKKIEGLRPHEEVGFGENEILAFVNSPDCPDDFKEAFQNIFPDNLEDYNENLWETGLIHGDLYYDNTLFDHNQLAYLLDFEQAGIGPLILDIGISMSGTCLEKGRVLPELVASYLDGYESVRPLQGAEIEHLTDAILIGLFSIALWRIKRFKLKQLNPEMADSYKELLYKAFLFHHRIDKK